MSKIRVRFAPSPTGPLHMGGVRTALYNYLFARKNNGKFILRIEDTDQTRYVAEAEEYIIESLTWCGIEIDEGVTKEGPYKPYRQSARSGIYEQYVRQLIESGWAYYAFDTPEELDEMRKKQESAKSSLTGYNYVSRNQMRNSLTLSANEVDELLNQNDNYVIRFKIPENETIKFHDIIRGSIEMNTETLDDKVIFKSDGLPTYHLANVVDDHLMKISHVIRGEEWLPSTPLHVLLYKAFSWDLPDFAHLPLILKPNGQGKLSKRDGDKIGFPVFPIEWKSSDGEIYAGYREDGYLPEAFVNLLALLGWNPGSENEFFTMDELIQEFSLERVGKAGAKFNPDKAKWFNHHYLQKKSTADLAESFSKLLNSKGIDTDVSHAEKITGLLKERINFVSDLWQQGWYFFRRPENYDPKDVRKRWKENTPAIIKQIAGILENTKPFNENNTEEAVKSYIHQNELNMGQVLNALRICLVGAARGPHLFTIIDLLGKDETLTRMEQALSEIPQNR